MPVQLSIQVRNAKLVKKAFEDLGREIPQISEGRIYGRMLSAQRAVTKYPDKPSGFRLRWRSEKQRRWFFWAMRNNVIRVPYERTGTYGRAWKLARSRGTGPDRGWRLFGRAVQHGRDYTKYVSGGARGEPQAEIHQGRWKPVREAVEEAMEGLPNDIEKHIVMAARRRGL